jgi:hypothetical protein
MFKMLMTLTIVMALAFVIVLGCVMISKRLPK